jgi:hypothetical protein
MEEKQIIAQLKEIREIKPGQEWTKDTKSYVLGTIQPQEKIFSGVFSMPFFKMPKLQPAMIIPVLMIIFVGAGIFAHFYLGSSEDIAKVPYESQAATYLVLAETRLAQVQNLEDMKAVSEMLGKATDSLSSLAKDPVETAKIVKSVTNIKEQIEELDEENTEGVGELMENFEILASATSAALEADIKSTTAELVKNLIKSLETSSLTDGQEELFKEIKLDYNNENYKQALEKLLMLRSE